jgi:hypothetical protein
MPQRNASPERARRPASEPGARRQPPGAAAAVPSVLQLGSALGNRSTATLLAGGLMQRKVAIGPADDPLEREAERAADRVLAAAASAAPGGSDAGASPAPVAPVPSVGATVQRECAACAAGGKRCAECEEKDEELRRASATGQTITAGADPVRVESRLAALGPGQPLATDLRGFFEPRFGHDFGAVRLHTGSTAAAAATAARARAFTLRQDVVFGAGEYAPASRGGRRLIAHELAHVVQQSPASGGAPVVRRQPAAAPPEPAAHEPPAPAGPGPAPEPATEQTAASLTAAAPAQQQDGAREAGAPRGLIVSDQVQPSPEQMTRTAFLDELQAAACSASEQGLAGTDRSAEGCPGIDPYFRVYREWSAERIEADLRRYVPAARSASRARDYIAPVAEHMRAGERRRAETGEPTGVPGTVRSPMEEGAPGSDVDGVRVDTDATASHLGGGEEEGKDRPGMGLAPGLAPGVDTRQYSLEEYITMWEAAAGRRMTDRERERLAAGCVGITRLNLGGAASLSECYDTFDQAKKRADELEKEFGKRPFIFSKRFWSMGAAYPPDPATGKVDMSGYTGAKPEGEVNFDYGWYDETTNTWWHANHCDPVIAGATCADAYDSTQRMKVYQSTLTHYSDPHYFGADVQVFCVAWSKLTK